MKGREVWYLNRLSWVNKVLVKSSLRQRVFQTQDRMPVKAIKKKKNLGICWKAFAERQFGYIYDVTKMCDQFNKHIFSNCIKCNKLY